MGSGFIITYRLVPHVRPSFGLTWDSTAAEPKIPQAFRALRELQTPCFPLVFDLLTFPFREFSTPENPLSLTVFLDSTFHISTMEAEHNVFEAARLPSRRPSRSLKSRGVVEEFRATRGRLMD